MSSLWHQKEVSVRSMDWDVREVCVSFESRRRLSRTANGNV
jgi:hypothetical protein